MPPDKLDALRDAVGAIARSGTLGRILAVMDPRSGKPITAAADRAELLAQHRAEPLAELRVSAVVYRQPKLAIPAPATERARLNRNFFRIAPEDVRAAGEAAAGRPFLRDHSWRLADRAGTIVESSVGEDDGEFVWRQTFSVVKGWAIEGVLDGTIETFSIGLDIGHSIDDMLDNARCSIDGGSYWNCSHLPGRVYALKDGSTAIAELIWRNVIAQETSAVTFPAVADTSIEDVRQAMAAARAQFATKPSKERVMDPKILAALGCAADADTGACVAQIEKLKERATAAEAQAEQVQAALEAEREQHAATKAARDELVAKDADREARELATAKERALDDKRLLAGSKSEAYFDTLVKAGNAAGALAFLDTLEGPADPALGALQQRGATPATPARSASVLPPVTARADAWSRQAGLTAEQIAAADRKLEEIFATAREG